MKKIILLASLFSTLSYAHDPFVAPLSYVTSNTQIPVLSGYAEHAFDSEYALKDASFTVVDPLQKSSTIKADNALKSVTVFDLLLPTDGTYKISSKVNYPIKYALHNKVWKPFYEVSAQDAGELAKRDYVIADDFPKNQPPSFQEIQREWTLESYVTKNKVSTLNAKNDAPIQVSFSVHPNQIKVNQAVQLNVSKSGKPLKNAQVKFLAEGQTEDQAVELQNNAQGTYELKLPKTGQYRIEVTEKVDMKQKPQNQYYSIVAVDVQH